MMSLGFVKRHYKAFLLFSGTCIVCLSLGFNAVIIPWYDKQQLGMKSKDIQAVAYKEPEAYVWSQATNYGGFSHWEINKTYAKQFLKDNFKWSLQASNNNNTWTDANQLLNIGLNWNNDSCSYKVTLTLNTTLAPRALYYRFDLACNKTLKQYLEMDGYEWKLTIPANNTKDYTLLFNWSDIKPLIQSGKVWFDKGVRDNFFWFRIQTVNRIAVGTVFVVDPTYGLIAAATTSTWEWNPETGNNVSAIRVNNSEYYLIGAGATNGQGTLNTIQVSGDTGLISIANVSRWTFNTTRKAVGSIIVQKVYGNIYVCAYANRGYDIQRFIYMFTFRVWDTNGTIQQSRVSGEVRSECLGQNTKSGANITSLLKMQVSNTDNIFVMAYCNWQYAFRLKSYNISNAGVITAGGNVTIDNVITKRPMANLAAVDSNTFVWVYSGMGTDGWMGTRNITAAGVIASANSSRWEFDQTFCSTPTIAKVTGTTYMFAYKDTNLDLYVKTCTISNAGGITKSTLDTQSIDTTLGEYPTFFNVSINAVANKWIKGISFSGESSDGYISTFDVNSTGIIGSEIDTLETVAADTVSWYMPACQVSGDYFLIINTDATLDGWAKTVMIDTRPSTVVDLYEWNGIDGLRPDMLRLGTSQYYLNAYQGTGNTGWVNTTQVYNDNGTIKKATIDSLQFDSVWCFGRISLYNVYGDIYAVAYQGPDSTVAVRTFLADDADGQIGAAYIDTLDFKYNNYLNVVIKKVSGNVFAVAYDNSTNSQSWLETCYIANDGTISNTRNDTVCFNAGASATLDMISIDSNTIAIAYAGTGSKGYLVTYNISATTGDITNTNASWWSYDTTSGWENIKWISGNVYAVAYRDGSGYIQVKTVTIATTGAITKSWIDSLAIETGGSSNYFPVLFTVNDSSVYGVTYRGPDDDGWLKTFSMTANGQIGASAITSIEFDNADSQNLATVAWVNKSWYYIAYLGTDNDGWSCVVYIKTNYASPTFSNPSPANASIDQALTPQCAITVNDLNGNLMTVNFYENSTGSYVLRQTNSSCTNGTYRWTDAQATANNQKYYWKVYCNDGLTSGTHNVSAWYYFTTIAGGVTTSWQIISQSINGSVYNASTYTWQIISTSINGSVYNNTGAWAIISQTINGSIYNTTGTWIILSQSINGSVYNATGTWNIISQSINGSVYNASISSWAIISQSINGSIYNSTGTWNIISQSINGSIYNLTGTWQIISQSINGSIYNTTGTWIILSQTINGSIYNVSGAWQIISQSINGSIYNVSGAWQILSSNINGSIYNASASSWQIISQSINGSVYNSSISSWQIISQSINGSIYNATGTWNIISQSINGSIYNQSGIWAIISQTINGSIYNSTGTWNIISSNINGSVYNASISSWNIVSQNINGSIYNASISTWAIISQTINGSIYNTTGTWIILSQSINGSVYNATGTWNIISQSINGSVYNASISSWAIISQSINGSIYNSTGTWNIIISNPYPTNNSIHIPINVTLSITINHVNGSFMNITWYWGNSSVNATHYLGSILNIINGTYFMAIAPANQTHTDYWWSVNVSDGYGSHANAIYNFTTGIKAGMIIVDKGHMSMVWLLVGVIIPIMLYFGIKGKKKRNEGNGE